MSDHRRVQRTLFRMQHDPLFAERLRGGDAEAVQSTGLDAADLALLTSAAAAAVAADAGGKRRHQFLRNVSSEHALTLHWAADASLLESFTESEEFHRAIREDLSLPLAFASHVRRRAVLAQDALLESLAVLEEAMARARRAPIERPSPPPGGIVLAPRADVLRVPQGSIAAAAAVREALDAGLPPPRLAVDATDVEHVLVLGSVRESPHRLAQASLELLSTLAGELLTLARQPAGPADLRDFALARDVADNELEEFLAALASDEVILRA